ncbi:hypothetical protein OUZ56_032841 [Daphnia magna]|uniref:Uncharacterized protein n=1 Tax=Daphnia magna TaxID=35525 RepID=A0ABR0B9P9_9CRUS|nr:hypothetical protein OUZ56_032841 [Daphnia magna]
MPDSRTPTSDSKPRHPTVEPQHPTNRFCTDCTVLAQLSLRETVSKGRDRHRYIPEGLFRPSDWLSPFPHSITPSTPSACAQE